uniref:Nudix hydrolase domain-containing protein n=1 Tax=Octactis speculum TaxID=3111310 RepID=A0A7S2DCT2_9STRA|mmetsp:Transcript_46707/g.63591  ORF Transcript_46707/g.63591 Transcript_46707/m.63591 type:complete len:302 (+) Transcript_46707:90-995(+)
MSSCIASCEPLRAKDDIYQGKIIDAHSVAECNSQEEFTARLAESLNTWRRFGRRGIWLEISGDHANFVSSALRLGFVFHHANPPCTVEGSEDSPPVPVSNSKGTVTLSYWIPGEQGVTSTLPSYATHSIGVGAMVINRNKEVLVVQERVEPVALKGLWKMPTGMVNNGEDACDCAVREVEEETGVKCRALKLVALREAHSSVLHGPQGRSNVFMVFLCEPEEDVCSIVKQDSEIAACKWMQMDEFLESLGKILPPETLYYVLSELGCHCAKGDYKGMDIATLPIGHYAGENRVYLNPRPKL